MTLKKAFLLTAGFGTRFQPHTNWIPKPALPIFNLPQALYPAGLLKLHGVEDFYYNSHHLPKTLNKSLEPYFKRPSFFEETILDSAGGIKNAEKALSSEENFWVINGDSFITYQNPNVLDEALEVHLKRNALATMICIPKPYSELSGLEFNQDGSLKDRSTKSSALHFTGIYILNSEVFNHIQEGPSHILKDVLLKPNLKNQVQIFNAKEALSWYETGNEKDYIYAHAKEAKKLSSAPLNSIVTKTHKIWKNHHLDQNLHFFLETKIWGNQIRSNIKKDFLCVPHNTTGDFSCVSNCCFAEELTFNSQKKHQNKLFVHNSQWQGSQL